MGSVPAWHAADRMTATASSVVADQLEPRIVEQVNDVLAPAGEEVIEAEHLLALANQPLAKVRANESRTTCDQDPHS